MATGLKRCQTNRNWTKYIFSFRVGAWKNDGFQVIFENQNTIICVCVFPVHRKSAIFLNKNNVNNQQ